MPVRCPYCGAAYTDASGALAGVQTGLAGSPVLVVAGCGRCGKLFVPDGGASDGIGREAGGRADGPRYELLELLGRGGMGETYKALDRITNTVVCIKRLLNPDLARTLIQEWRALERLQHRNIVRVLGVEDIEGSEPRVVMEYVPGYSLRALLNRQRLLSEPLAIDIALKICEALAYTSARDVIHCDLKPDNVMLRLDGTVVTPKVLDFGLAVVARRDADGAITAVNRPWGTMPYMAPEQHEGRMLDARCDVYALGLMLHESLTGRRAFAGLDFMAAYRAKQAHEGGLDLGGECGSQVTEIVRRCTSADPRRRPTPAEALALLSRAVVVVPAPGVPAPLNLSFDQPEESGWPPGWFDSRGFVDGVSTPLTLAHVAAAEVPGGRCLEVTARGVRPEQFGSVMQRCPAAHLRGRRLRFTGLLATEDVSGMAGLWLRADGRAGSLFFDNMGRRPIRGTTPWARYSIEAAVPTETEWLNYGLLLLGNGRLRAADLHVQVIEPDGDWTDLSVDPVTVTSPAVRGSVDLSDQMLT